MTGTLLHSRRRRSTGQALVVDNDGGLRVDGGGEAVFAGGGFHDLVAVPLQRRAYQPAHLHFKKNRQE